MQSEHAAKVDMVIIDDEAESIPNTGGELHSMYCVLIDRSIDRSLLDATFDGIDDRELAGDDETQ
jgi:hypothetical protein